MQSLKTPNVYRSEKDISEVTVNAGTSVGALVMSARQGVVNQRVLINSDKNLVETFGIPIPDGSDVGIYAGLQFLKESNDLFVVRATSGTEKYSGITVGSVAVTGSNVTTVLSAAASTGAENNTPFYIADLDDKVGTNALIVACKGPGSYGNNIGITIETSASPTSADWSEKYEPSISGSIYKLSVYIKQPSQATFDGIKAEEVFYGSNTYQKDSGGNQLFIEKIVNGISQYIYVNAKEDLLPGIVCSGNSTSNIPVGLSGGADSDTKFRVDYTKQNLAWGLFADKTKVGVNILMETLRTPQTAPKTAEIVAGRLDCIACVQQGSDSAKTVSAIIGSTGLTITNPSSSYVAIYGGWDKVYDNFNDRDVWLPRNIFGACIMARTDRIAQTWDAPAGLNRGILPTLAQNVVLSDSDIGELYDKNINFARQVRGVGNVIWGQKTAQKKKSALDRINVRRLLLFIENTVEATLLNFLFEPNTSKVRARIFDLVNSFLKSIESLGGVTKYEVVCDDSNNTPLTIDNNELIVDIYVQPTKTIEYIRMNVIITKTGVNFSEIR